jgi:hypothetical protein
MQFTEWLIALLNEPMTPPPSHGSDAAVCAKGWIERTPDGGLRPTKSATALLGINKK